MKQRLFTRDFTLLALGQAFSLLGNYALRLALSMYVLELTGSAGVFAGMLALAMAPTVLLSPLGGALADRCDRRRLMAGMDAASGLAVLLALPFFRAAGASFFVSGTAAVGFPHLVRNVLGLSAELYDASESVLGAAAVLGALAAGIFGPRLKRWERLVGAFGLALLPAGAGFAARLGPTALYLLLTCGLFAGQFVCSMFSVLALSHIQQRTPEHLTGKVTALTMTLSTCAQPLGQLLYGQFFDLAGSAPEYVLLPTAAALCLLPRALYLQAGEYLSLGDVGRDLSLIHI